MIQNRNTLTVMFFLVCFGTSWVMKLTFLNHSKEASFKIITPQSNKLESLDCSERILTQLDKYQARIDLTQSNNPSSSYVENPEKEAQQIWEMYREARKRK